MRPKRYQALVEVDGRLAKLALDGQAKVLFQTNPLS